MREGAREDRILAYRRPARTPGKEDTWKTSLRLSLALPPDRRTPPPRPRPHRDPQAPQPVDHQREHPTAVRPQRVPQGVAAAAVAAAGAEEGRAPGAPRVPRTRRPPAKRKRPSNRRAGGTPLATTSPQIRVPTLRSQGPPSNPAVDGPPSPRWRPRVTRRGRTRRGRTTSRRPGLANLDSARSRRGAGPRSPRKRQAPRGTTRAGLRAPQLPQKTDPPRPVTDPPRRVTSPRPVPVGVAAVAGEVEAEASRPPRHPRMPTKEPEPGVPTSQRRRRGRRARSLPRAPASRRPRRKTPRPRQRRLPCPRVVPHAQRAAAPGAPVPGAGVAKRSPWFAGSRTRSWSSPRTATAIR